MNGWVKNFVDGTTEEGSDHDVELRHRSWRKGRLDDMIGAELHHDDVHIYIDGTGEFWQSDDYEVAFLKSEPLLVRRRIQKRIHHSDDYMYSSSLYKTKCIVFCNQSDKYTVGGMDRVDRVPDRAEGKWFTAEYHLKEDRVEFSFKENRI